MANLVLAMFTSLDGYTEGPNGHFVQPPWSDQASGRWAKHNLDHAGHLLYGRVNFEFNRAFWTSDAAGGMPETATMNRLAKTIVSRAPSGAPGWNGTFAHEPLAATVARLKASVTPGDIYCFGGARIAHALMAEDLVDEYRIMLTPTLLGDGARLFAPGGLAASLRLVDMEKLDVGSVILTYTRA